MGEHLPYKQRVIGSSPIVSIGASKNSHYGPVVQLVRTLACHARGQGFESPSGRHDADLAHLVERNLAKVEVAGSSPVIRSKNRKAGQRPVFFVFDRLTRTRIRMQVRS